MQQALADFLRHLALEKNASVHTVKSYREDLTQAVTFFQTRLGTDSPEPARLTQRLLRAFAAWLHDQGYAKTTVARRVAAVRSWCRFLCRQGTLTVEAAQVSLLRWLRRQLRQPIPVREHLEAAVENDDVVEARRLLAGFEFSDAQRRNVEQLLDAWERQTKQTS